MALLEEMVLVQMVLLVPRVNLEIPVTTVQREKEVTLVRLVITVPQVPMERTVIMVEKEFVETLGHQVSTVLLELWDHPDLWDRQDHVD